MIVINGITRLARQLQDMPLNSNELTQVSGKGAANARLAIMGRVPIRTGMLRKAIEIRKERIKQGAEKHYSSVTVDPKGRYNSTFQIRDAQGHITAYYPASQEFGWRPSKRSVKTSLPKGQRRKANVLRAYKATPKLVPGKFYMQGGNAAAESTSILRMQQEIVKILRSKGAT